MIFRNKVLMSVNLVAGILMIVCMARLDQSVPIFIMDLILAVLNFYAFFDNLHDYIRSATAISITLADKRMIEEPEKTEE